DAADFNMLYKYPGHRDHDDALEAAVMGCKTTGTRASISWGGDTVMNKLELFDRLANATETADAFSAISKFRALGGSTIEEIPVGFRANNRGTIDVATDPGRSIVERITNAIDALLELEHRNHNGKPVCRTPRDAAQAWFGIDDSGRCASVQRHRQQLARKTLVTL